MKILKIIFKNKSEIYIKFSINNNIGFMSLFIKESDKKNIKFLSEQIIIDFFINGKKTKNSEIKMLKDLESNKDLKLNNEIIIAGSACFGCYATN